MPPGGPTKAPNAGRFARAAPIAAPIAAAARPAAALYLPTPGSLASGWDAPEAVSYTHLTLPTIPLV